MHDAGEYAWTSRQRRDGTFGQLRESFKYNILTFQFYTQAPTTKPRTQTLNFVNGYAMPRDSNSNVDVLVANPYADAPVRGGISEYTPAYVKLNGLVLCFSAYFEEDVTNSQFETKRIRKFVIYYHVEDGSIKIIEPRQANSGMPQGAFLKRHIIPQVTLRDLKIGESIEIYGKTFSIYRCDSFTREYLQSALGVEVPSDRDEPDGDAKSKSAAARDAKMTRKKDARGKFLTHDKQVLRFYCVWNDESQFGDRRKFVLQYFLIDDTVSISEAEPSGGGYGISSTMLNRSRLPIKDEDAGVHGPTQDMFDYVTADDLRVGGFIRAYKRNFFIYAADEFTKSWYVEKKGMRESDFTPIDVSEPKDAPPAHRIPPHEGLAIGSEEDSLQNCISLIPKAPRRCIEKQFAFDKCVLQFRARMVSVDGSDRDVTEFDASRCFVVSYYVADDTLSIFERASKDSFSSKFLERAKVKKTADAYYDVRDMFVGSKLLIHSRAFELKDTDEYTAAFLAQHVVNENANN